MIILKRFLRNYGGIKSECMDQWGVFILQEIRVLVMNCMCFVWVVDCLISSRLQCSSSMFFLKLHSTARVLVEPVAMTLSLTDGWILWTLVVFSEMFYSNRMLEWKHLWSYGEFIYWDVAELIPGQTEALRKLLWRNGMGRYSLKMADVRTPTGN